MQTRFKGKIQAMLQIGSQKKSEQNPTSSRKSAKKSVSKNESEQKVQSQPKKSKAQLLQQKMRQLKQKKKQEQAASAQLQNNEAQHQVKEQQKQQDEIKVQLPNNKASQQKVVSLEKILKNAQQQQDNIEVIKNTENNEMHRKEQSSQLIERQSILVPQRVTPQPKCQTVDNKFKQQKQSLNLMHDQKQIDKNAIDHEKLLVELKQKQEQRVKQLHKEQALRRFQKMQEQLKNKSIQNKLKKQSQQAENQSHKIINQSVQREKEHKNENINVQNVTEKVRDSQNKIIKGAQHQQIQVDSEQEQQSHKDAQNINTKVQIQSQRQQDRVEWWQHPIICRKQQQSEKGKAMKNKLLIKELFKVQSLVKNQIGLSASNIMEPSKCNPKFVLTQFEILRQKLSNM